MSLPEKRRRLLSLKNTDYEQIDQIDFDTEKSGRGNERCVGEEAGGFVDDDDDDVNDFGMEEDSADNCLSSLKLLCPGALSCCLSIIFAPTWLFSVRMNRHNEAKLALNWGQYVTVKNTSGLFLVNPFGVQLKSVSLKERAMELRDEKLVDLKGNPVVCSGCIFWRVSSVKASTLNVEDVSVYVKTCALATLKQVVAKYPYSPDFEGQPSLQTEGEALGRELKLDLQKRLAHAGVKVLAFNMTDLSYAPEIAKAMLVKQQAEAMIRARQIIVKGAVDMSEEALNQLHEKKICQLSDADRTRILSQMLSIFCADSKGNPTTTIQASSGALPDHRQPKLGR
ncbi:PHB domain-containing protein [Chloropicon primus]|nr:PHB domain-containing protein [Chloropicon primus]